MIDTTHARAPPRACVCRALSVLTRQIFSRISGMCPNTSIHVLGVTHPARDTRYTELYDYCVLYVN